MIFIPNSKLNYGGKTMAIDFSRLNDSNRNSPIEPRDIFMSLPNKKKEYNYPRDVQTEVWNQWFEGRNKKNTIIKMNTGSGKTTVGLTILQSCLNEGKGPAVYVVPDNYLVKQVCEEAERLGIKVSYEYQNSNGTVKGEDDYFFKNSKAIFVTNIYKLVNGKSVFGLRNNNNNIPIGSIVIDDVHACLDTIEQQCTISIPRNDELYDQIIEIFSRFQSLNCNNTFFDITCEFPNPCKYMAIPFWVWQKCCEDIRRLMIHNFPERDYVIFNLPLIEDIFKTCNCTISSRCIEITPKCIPISKIVEFERAQRRIFMSATLANDDIFVSTLGLKENEINLITPEKADDIGDRLILFPKHLNSQNDDKIVREKIVEIAHQYNCVVIVPSYERAKFWLEKEDEVNLQVLSSSEDNIYTGIGNLKNGNFTGLTVLVNKYDGVDLPDNACRFLVIDGLPIIRSQFDIVNQSMNYEDRRIIGEQIQKIEQGMGRGVRSNNDYCVVVLMGNNLADIIINQNGMLFFSNATKQQFETSKNLWDLLMETSSAPTVDEIFDLSNCVINRDKNWVAASRNAMSSIRYKKKIDIDKIALAKRKAFEMESAERYEDAFSIIETEKNANLDFSEKEKAILLQLMAEYKNFSNPENAQEIQCAAYKLNNMVSKPINGIKHYKFQQYTGTQSLNILKYIQCRTLSPNSFIIHVQAILDELNFFDDTAHSFENALNNLAFVIGFVGSRNENEGGPDNLWSVGDSKYFVIECKNGVNKDVSSISKKDCEQLLSSIQWFENNHNEHGCTCVPILIHRSVEFEKHASPNPNTRIMTEQLLGKLKSAVNKFSLSISQPEIWGDAHKIQRIINQSYLDSNSIIKEYTTSPK